MYLFKDFLFVRLLLKSLRISSEEVRWCIAEKSITSFMLVAEWLRTTFPIPLCWIEH